MARKQAMQKLDTMARKYGLALDEEMGRLYSLTCDKNWLSYIVHCNYATADYRLRKAVVKVRVDITVRGTTGGRLSVDDLASIQEHIVNARMLLLDLQAHPIRYTEKW